jgi:sigma-E factor negative regulatory protein RseA
MKERLSELMDGELDDRSAAAVLEALGRDRQALQAWGNYHMIGDAMRGGRPLSQGFGARLSARLAAEPTVLALRAETRKWFALSAAASLAAVAFVGWMAFAPQPGVAPAATPVAKAQPEAKPNIVPLPTAANDYLLAHQGFSPRVSLQGMAPYVRTVSEQAEVRR